MSTDFNSTCSEVTRGEGYVEGFTTHLHQEDAQTRRYDHLLQAIRISLSLTPPPPAFQSFRITILVGGVPIGQRQGHSAPLSVRERERERARARENEFNIYTYQHTKMCAYVL